MAVSGCEIDAFVGSRIRMRREALGISQKSLGGHLGLTFSQIQKYEKGSNRIGAGRLYQIASYLGVTVSDFFEGLERPAETSNKEIGPPRDEVRHLTEAFASIPDSEIRASVLALVRSLAPN
ncbi:MAG TPA: helix-turn-helix transcriptional regulator, partial [Thermoleophilaceae bacterium]|nr:helix-turn-helix transcriptional regulator [Thermoleophilaceae bacterium]